MSLVEGTRDVFLSHSSGDKGSYVLPLARALAANGISYWLDEAEIHWGDRITEKINQGITVSRYVIVFLSPAFLEKNWTLAELGAALARENSSGQTIVLPLIIGPPKAVLE